MAMIPSSSAISARLHEKLECLRGMMQQLNSKADDIQNELRNEELQARKKRKSEVALWLQQVSSIEEPVRSIGIEVAQVGFFRRGQFSEKLEAMMDTVEQLIKQSEFPRGLLHDDIKPEGLELVAVKMEGPTPSRVRDEVWRCFERGERRVAIFGIGGVGKTSSAMHINNEILKKKRLFERVYYVTVSRETSVHKLQSDIAKAFCHSLEYEDETKRAAELREALAKREKSLLILDDVWEDITMEEVGVLVESDGCKLLITTRDRGVCRKMKCWPVHMETLSPDESLDLFKKQLGNFETLPDELKVTAALVAKECDGLPLGIATMAGSMRGETSAPVWRDARRKLQDPCSTPHDMEDKVFKILRFSYDRLKEEKHRKCFLYCALYGEDYEIEKEELIRQYIAVGLLDGTNREESLDEGYTLLNVLENASLLERAEVMVHGGFVKMHDLVRDMAIRIMGTTSTGMVIEGRSLKEILGQEQWINKDLQWVSLLHNRCDSIEGVMPDCPNISVLFLHDFYLKTISNSFFVKMISLKVLHLSCAKVNVLPASVSNLCNLNSLLLRFCESLVLIPSLAKLMKLRHLVLHDCCRMTKLPEGMKELTSLEYLDLNLIKVEVLPASVSDLCNLNTLSLMSCSELHYVPSLAKLTKLINLTLWSCNKLETLPDGMEALANLENLALSGTQVEVLPSSISDLCNLEDLWLCNCSSLHFIPSLAKLRKLRRLSLDGCRKVETLPEGMEELTSLKYLNLQKTGIKGLYRGVFIKLLNLESFLGNDEIIVPPELLMRLKHLEKLIGVHFKYVSEFNRCVDLGVFNRLETYHVSVGHYHYITNCCPLDDKDDDDTEFIKAICWNGVSGGEECFMFPQNASRLEFRECSFGGGSLLGDLPSLGDATTDLSFWCSADDFDCIIPEGWTKPLQRIQMLVLEDLDEFGGLIREEVVYPYISFSGLTFLYIENCRKLKKLWMLNLDLPNLEVIAIADCGQMEEIFATGKGGTVKLPRMRSLKLKGLPELRSIWGNCEVFFPHLISLEVIGFQKMKKIGRVSRNLSSLKTISIFGCDELEEIFAAEDEAGDDQIHLPKLEELVLDYLPQLRSISRKTIVCNSLQLVSIRATPDENQPELENCPISVPSLSASGPLPNLSAYNMPKGWWESLQWNDPATLSNFHHLGCFSYCWNLSTDEPDETEYMDEDDDKDSIS